MVLVQNLPFFHLFFFGNLGQRCHYAGDRKNRVQLAMDFVFQEQVDVRAHFSNFFIPELHFS